MRQRTLTAFALIAALAALFVAGCGGDDETTSSTTAGASGATGATGTALTTEEFLKQGNAICAAGNEEIESAANQMFSGQPTEAQLEQFATDTLVPSVQGQIAALRALTPPEDLADQVDTFLTDAESALGEVESDPSLVAASGSDDPFADVNAQAKDVGLAECAG